MKKLSVALLLVVVSISIISGKVFAQSEKITLTMSRDWGYAGFNSDIQGLFTMRVVATSEVVRVGFYIDNTKIGELDKLPFNLQFNTDDLPLGLHQLYAIGYSSSGAEYRSNVISANFVPQLSTLKFILPVLGVIVVALLIAALLPFVMKKKNNFNLPSGTERNYGINGGAICPKCHRPFALPILTMHLGFSKLAVCPYCGKWSLVRRESIEKLRMAEKDELRSSQPSLQVDMQQTEEDKNKKELDDSKYQN